MGGTGSALCLVVSIGSASGFIGTSLAWLFAPIGFGISAVGRVVDI